MMNSTYIDPTAKTYTDTATGTKLRYRGGSGVDVIPSTKLPLLFKVLDKNGDPRSGGAKSFEWSLPTARKPGEWMRIDEELNICRVGLHLTDFRHLSGWTGDRNDRFFIAEVNGAAITQSGYNGDTYDKYCVAEARLVKEVPADVAKALAHRVHDDILGERPWTLERMTSDSRIKTTTAWWEKHREDVWDIVKEKLPVDEMSPMELSLAKATLVPENRWIGYSGSTTDPFRLRYNFYAARKKFYDLIDHQETQAEMDELQSAKKFAAMVRAFQKTFLTTDSIEHSLARFATPDSELLLQGLQDAVGAAVGEAQASYKEMSDAVTAFMKKYKLAEVSEATKPARTRQTRVTQ